MIKFESAAVTDVGTVRFVNEDSFLERTEDGFWLVADGMGGHFAGDYASQAVVHFFKQISLEHQDLLAMIDRVDIVLDSVNQHLIDFAKEKQKSVVGSTAVMLVVRPQLAAGMWVGDSRLYRLRDEHLEQVTVDHSLVQELIDLKQITTDEAQLHPHKNIITRAIGSESQVYSDIRLFYPQKDDVYLLCSDGLYNVLTHERMTRILCDYDIKKAVKIMMLEALENGADDNVTIIGVRVTELDNQEN